MSPAIIDHVWDPVKKQDTRNVEQGDRVIDHKTWRKVFKKCRCKRRYKKRGSGGTDILCPLLGGLTLGRCWYSKCPKVLPNWPEYREEIRKNWVDAPKMPKCIGDDPINGVMVP